MVLTGQDSIRDVLLFPAMRPLPAHAPEAEER
jgi:lysyl-tRNA synthetase class II